MTKGCRLLHFTGERGQNVVEFALTLPIFVGLLLGFFYTAILLYSQVTLTNAARVGANYLVRKPLATDQEVEALIRANLGVLDQTALTITITPPREERVPHVQMDVSLRYRAPLPTFSIPNLGGGRPVVLIGPLMLMADSTMNVE